MKLFLDMLGYTLAAILGLGIVAVFGAVFLYFFVLMVG